MSGHDDLPAENPYSYDGAAAPTRSGDLPDRMENWIPPKNVTMHNGDAIPKTMIFPIDPPAEIGKLYTASSDWYTSLFARLRHDPKFWPPVLGLFIVNFLFVLPFETAIIIGLSKLPQNLGMIICIPLLALFFFIHYITIRAARTNYFQFVGQNGFCTMTHYRKKIESKIVLFKDCRMIREDPHPNDEAMGIQLELLLKDGSGKSLIVPSHGGSNRVDRFDASVELAWTIFFKRQLLNHLVRGKRYDFKFDDKKMFRLTRRGFFLINGPRTTPLAKENIQHARVKSGRFELVVGIDPLSDDFQELSFSVAKIVNFRAFLIMLQRTIGIDIEQRYFAIEPDWYPGMRIIQKGNENKTV